ncbi:set domain protein [Culex quinquefasciatus]|uniref:Set domain protein n=1 Tax=Culex quinquefasciatus TaxID=7176 RepID=B0XAT8_CULQU|nr:set domain protein [Culex quinquefasciatus]|eukprot:XP_001866760.1 set domain protein [Culex quinquefasciatus]
MDEYRRYRLQRAEVSVVTSVKSLIPAECRCTIVWAKYSVFMFWPVIAIPPPAVLDVDEQTDIYLRFIGMHDLEANLPLSQRRLGQRDGPEAVGHHGAVQRVARQIFERLQAEKAHAQESASDNLSFKLPMYVKIKFNKNVAPLRGRNATRYEEALSSWRKLQDPVLQTKAVTGTGGQTDLIAQEDIHQGQFVIEYVGEVINNEELARRIKQKQDQKVENYYFLTMNTGLTTDSGPKGNMARFIYHSCEPNCETLLWKVGGSQYVWLFDLRDLKAGQGKSTLRIHPA